MLVSVAEQAGLSLTWSETREDTFSHDEAQVLLETFLPNEAHYLLESILRYMKFYVCITTYFQKVNLMKSKKKNHMQ